MGWLSRLLYGTDGSQTEGSRSGQPDDDQTDGYTEPLRRSNFQSGPTFDCTIFVGRHLYDKYGHSPSRATKKFVERAFANGFVSHDVTVVNQPVMTPDDPGVGRRTVAWFDPRKPRPPDTPPKMIDSFDGSVPWSTHSNILLVDSSGGGGTFGAYSAVGADEMDRVPTWTPAGSQPIYNQLHNVLHEIGHNLGLGHDMDAGTPGNQHTGVGWNDDSTERWYRTPTTAGNGVTNECGRNIPNRQYSDASYLLTYTPCAYTHMDFRTEDE